MPPVPARERGGREILRGMRRAAGPGVRELRAASSPRPRSSAPSARTRPGLRRAASGQRFGSPESYTPKHLAEKILTSKAPSKASASR